MMEEIKEFESRIDVTDLHKSVEEIKQELKKVIVGQDNLIEHLIIALLSNGHILLEGMPGVAKTLAARLLAKTVDAGFSRIQFTPDLMPSDVTGTMIFNRQSSQFEFREGPVFSNIILIDEINRAPAKTQSALFECMQEYQVTIDGTSHPLPAPFMIIATQNPVDHEGTYRLPEAQLDRFLFKINIDYPSLEEERTIIDNHHQRKHVVGLDTVKPVLKPAELAKHKATVAEVVVKDTLVDYIAQIVHATRTDNSLYIAASPRASLSILESSKAMALLRGRDFVTPEDVKEVIVPVMNHRITLTPEVEMEGRTTADVLDQIISKLDVPR